MERSETGMRATPRCRCTLTDLRGVTRLWPTWIGAARSVFHHPERREYPMSESKTECTRCGSSILRSTADRNNGRCEPCASGKRVNQVSDSMELGLRLLLGIFFAGLVGGLGYSVGASFGTIGGLFVAVPSTLAGFIYGCFCVEINAIARTALHMMIDL